MQSIAVSAHAWATTNLRRLVIKLSADRPSVHPSVRSSLRPVLYTGLHDGRTDGRLCCIGPMKHTRQSLDVEDTGKLRRGFPVVPTQLGQWRSVHWGNWDCSSIFIALCLGKSCVSETRNKEQWTTLNCLERPLRTFKTRKNHSFAPDPAWELTALPRPLAGRQEAGCLLPRILPPL